jgi:hypothetical protein
LKEKAKERIDIALSLSEKNQYDLWVRLEDAEHEIEEIHRKYEGLISKAEKDCADCYQELKQKLQKWFDKYRVEWIKCPQHLTCVHCENAHYCEFQNVVKEFEELLKEV